MVKGVNCRFENSQKVFFCNKRTSIFHTALNLGTENNIALFFLRNEDARDCTYLAIDVICYNKDADTNHLNNSL